MGATVRRAVFRVPGRECLSLVSLCMHSGCEIPVGRPQILFSHPLPNLPAHCLVSSPWSRIAEAIWSFKAGHSEREKRGRWLVCRPRKAGEGLEVVVVVVGLYPSLGVQDPS